MSPFNQHGEYPNRVLAMLSYLKGEPVAKEGMIELIARNPEMRLQLIEQIVDALDTLTSATIREMELRTDARYGKPVT